MNLEELVDSFKTDKNTLHSYLPLYQKLLESKKESLMCSNYCVKHINKEQ